MAAARGALRRLAPGIQRLATAKEHSSRASEPLFPAAAAADLHELVHQRGLRALSGFAASRSASAIPDIRRGPVADTVAWVPLGSAHNLAQLRFMAGARGQQKGAVPPANVVGLGSSSSRQLSVTSPNVIREQYVGPPPPLQVKDFMSVEGLSGLYKRMLGNLKNIYTVAKVKKDVPGWSLQGFKEEATFLYRTISEGIASGRVADVRRHLTDLMFGELKRQVKSRELGGWERVHWELVSVDQVSLVQGRLAVPSGMGTELAFAQFTVEFETQQRFAAYGSGGELVAGSLDKTIPVRELWVFERSLVAPMPNKAWRLAGRLALPKQR